MNSNDFKRVFTLAVLVLTFSGGVVSAQGYSSGRRPKPSYASSRPSVTTRPAFSPYLNLLRQGDPVLNYYGLVRPEQEFRAANEQFRTQFSEVERELKTVEEREAASNLGATGHRVQFLSDQRGGVGSVAQSLSERTQRGQNLPPIPGSRIAPSGHGAYFNNNGAYYRGASRE